MKHGIALAFFLFLLAPLPVLAADQCVNPGGTGGCLNNVQDAVDAAVPGETVTVAAGTYAGSLELDGFGASEIVGAGAATTSLTGGIQITGVVTGLHLEGLSLSGDVTAGRNAVIDGNPGEVNDFTLLDCVLDGGWDGVTDVTASGRHAVYRAPTGGSMTWTGNEFRNFGHWYVADNTNSGAPLNPLTDLTITNNYFHHIGGSMAFRGDATVPIGLAVISGNMFDYTGVTPNPFFWDALEVNTVDEVVVADNFVTGISGGGAFQFWSPEAWTMGMSCNVITDNAKGVMVAVIGGLYTPGGSSTLNNFSGNAAYAITQDFAGGGVAGGSGANAGFLDAMGNYWGAGDGPSGAEPGSGDPVGDDIDVFPFLSSPVPGGGTCSTCAVGAVSHKAYVSCVAKQTKAAQKAGLITKAERKVLVKAAAHSDIGK